MSAENIRAQAPFVGEPLNALLIAGTCAAAGLTYRHTQLQVRSSWSMQDREQKQRCRGGVDVENVWYWCVHLRAFNAGAGHSSHWAPERRNCAN